MQAVAQDTTTQVAARKKRSAPLDPQVADRLLELLSTDDDFRALFMREPREALRQVGFVNDTDLTSPHFCFLEIRQLASKREIAAARGEIRAMLSGGLAMTPIQLDAGLNKYRDQ